MTEPQNSKKSILFVGRQPSLVEDLLGETFNVEKFYMLNPNIIPIVRQQRPSFDAMVTHVPFGNLGRPLPNQPMEEYWRNAYADSLNILEIIRTTSPKMPIVAYTGASETPSALFKSYVNEVIPATNDKELDARLLERTLIALL